MSHLGGGLTSRGSRHSSRDALAEEDKPSAPTSRYSFGGGSGSSNMDANELTERLKQATSGRSSRFSDSNSNNSNSNRETEYTPTGLANPDGRRSLSGGRSSGPLGGRDTGRSSEASTVRASFGALGLSDNGDSSDDDFEENMFVRGGQAGGVNDDADEEEDMKRKEEELKAELQFATMRCEELKRTLQETKAYIAPADGKAAGSNAKAGAGVGKGQSNYNGRDGAGGGGGGGGGAEDDEDEEDEEDDDEYEYEDSVDYEESWADDDPPPPTSGKNMIPPQDPIDSSHVTPKKPKPQAIAVRESPFMGLQDPPTPTGRLSDRIERLRLRCIEALGRDSFLDAYRFLKQYDDMYSSRSYEDEEEEEKLVKMRAILGDSKAHYTPLIEQLIFMEETHRP